MANEYSKPKKAAFCKINVDTQSTISRAHGVSAMPTFIIFHAGKPIETIRGANPPALATAVANAMKLPDKTKAGGASFGTPGRTLGGQGVGVGAAAGSGGLPPSRPYNSGFDVVSILRHLFTIAALYVVTLVAVRYYLFGVPEAGFWSMFTDWLPNWASIDRSLASRRKVEL